jgi:thioredoxin-dependent peroxiredoxin
MQLGDTAPDFIADTTVGPISFHEWIGHYWCLLFSHPKDFTPVCTTELGRADKLQDEFGKRGVKMIALSVDSVDTHKRWIRDIEETQNTSNFSLPIIGDEKGEIARLYGMIHPKASDTNTVRAVFLIDPEKIIRMMMSYPASTGRNFDEIIRVIDALQLTDTHKAATPADWREGDECIILPSITNEVEIEALFPKGYRELKPYLRMTPDPRK